LILSFSIVVADPFEPKIIEDPIINEPVVDERLIIQDQPLDRDIVLVQDNENLTVCCKSMVYDKPFGIAKVYDYSFLDKEDCVTNSGFSYFVREVVSDTMCVKDNPLCENECGTDCGVVVCPACEECPVCETEVVYCGDGKVNQYWEECDDGNTVSGDGCYNCTSKVGDEPFCGNGIKEEGEECDDGNVVSGDGCYNCIFEEPVCCAVRDDESSIYKFAYEWRYNNDCPKGDYEYGESLPKTMPVDDGLCGTKWWCDYFKQELVERDCLNCTLPNYPPVAYSAVHTTERNTPIYFPLECSDFEVEGLEYFITEDVNFGYLYKEGYYVKYSPENDYIGEDDFYFKCNDGQYDSNIAKVKILVVDETIDNNPPIAQDQVYNIYSGEWIYLYPVCVDPDEDTLTYTIPDDTKLGKLQKFSNVLVPYLTLPAEARYVGTVSDSTLNVDGSVGDYTDDEYVEPGKPSDLKYTHGVETESSSRLYYTAGTEFLEYTCTDGELKDTGSITINIMSRGGGTGSGVDLYSPPPTYTSTTSWWLNIYTIPVPPTRIYPPCLGCGGGGEGSLYIERDPMPDIPESNREKETETTEKTPSDK
jgi:cysteine-rich repeat protein